LTPKKERMQKSKQVKGGSPQEGGKFQRQKRAGRRTGPINGGGCRCRESKTVLQLLETKKLASGRKSGETKGEQEKKGGKSKGQQETPRERTTNTLSFISKEEGKLQSGGKRANTNLCPGDKYKVSSRAMKQGSDGKGREEPKEGKEGTPALKYLDNERIEGKKAAKQNPSSSIHSERSKNREKKRQV